MKHAHRRTRFALGLVVAAGALVASSIPAGAAVDTEVSVGAANPFSGNKQNEPAVAIDPNHENLIVAGANDNIDLEDCNAGADNNCPFTPGVGDTGVTFSTDGGTTWQRPTYTGYSARNCVGVAEPPAVDDDCVPQIGGPIGTLPWYYEDHVVSGGDPALAFGPAPDGAGGFDWSNGSRLYAANLTDHFPDKHKEGTFKGVEAIGVSRLDVPDPSTAAQQDAVFADKDSWQHPSLISPGGAGFSDKEQIWADNATSSSFFGNVYVCFGNYVGGPSAGSNTVRELVATSTDGGDTWSKTTIEKNTDASSGQYALISGNSGCTIRTTSDGDVYVFWLGFNQNTKEQVIRYVVSTDGGATFSPSQEVFTVHATGVFDPVIGRNTMDGIAGARGDLGPAPSIDIANGAPDGTGATDQIVLNWVDGETLNDEHVRFSTSTDGGDTWSTPVNIESDPDDRGYYTATAISPDGEDVWVTYNAFTEPYQTDTDDPRPLLAVVLHADTGGPLSFTEEHRSPDGDARGASQNDLTAEFLGDYVYAAARNSFAAFVWNDVRDAADCPAIDTWRMSLRTKTTSDNVPKPEPAQDCPDQNFGNTSIYGAAIGDPTP